MELLITPEQVAEEAFRAPDLLPAEAVSEATILAAQQKFIRPVVGGLYERMCSGAYPELVEGYIRQPLALYVKLLMLPSLSVQSGAAGVVEPYTANLAKVSDSRLSHAVRRLRGEASALMDRAVGHIESNAADYPEYEPRTNVRRRCSIEGQVVL